jgi:predicted methyltransferase
MRNVAVAVLSAVLVSGAAFAVQAGHAPRPTAAQAAAVSDKTRPEKDVARDADRKPAETLAFAGVRPGMVVVDYWPGGGYFTRLLSRAVGPNGRVYAMAPDVLKQKFGEKAVTQLTSLGKDPATPNVKADFVTAEAFATIEPVDMVWTTNNYHDMHDAFAGPIDVAKFNKAVFAALKPGGVYLVADHAAEAGSGLRDTDTLHRIDPEQVKKEVTAAGFVFEGQSDLLRNSSDDHKSKIFDSGIRAHTDQFIYKFRKPRH